MSSSWRGMANRTSGAAKIANIDLYLKRDSAGDIAPIDRYYEFRTRAIVAAKPELLADAPWLSGYILVSIISATELYFREIFSKAIFLCPVSKKLSSEKNINIGAILWHGQTAFSRAAFEHYSLADVDKIRACSRDYLGFDIKKTNGTNAALNEFDKLCELRHGIVHAGCFLPGKNAIKLMVGKSPEDAVVEFDAARLHEAAATCTSLIESYNSELYEEMIERWAIKWRQADGWDSKQELTLLKKICDIFHSSTNFPDGRPSVIRLKNAIKRHYAI